MGKKENFSKVTPWGPSNQSFGGNTPRIGGKRYWVIVAYTNLQAIAESKVCTEFEENR